MSIAKALFLLLIEQPARQLSVKLQKQTFNRNLAMSQQSPDESMLLIIHPHSAVPVCSHQHSNSPDPPVQRIVHFTSLSITLQTDYSWCVGVK